MSEEVIYRVLKSFRYGKKLYKPGQEFHPAGGRFDRAILDPENRMVQIEHVTKKQKEEQPCQQNVSASPA